MTAFVYGYGMAGFEFRQPTVRDYLRIAELDRSVWRDYPNSENLSDSEHTWRHWVEDAVVYCAYDGDEIIGAAIAFPTMKKHFWLHKIFTIKEYRARGVALRLMEKILQHLEREKLPCFLTVSPDNQAAINLYKKLGFKEEGNYKGYYRDFEDRLVLYRD